MLAMMGHGWAVQAIIALVISTAFLVWVGGKEGAPFARFGKVVAWIAIILTGLMVIGSLLMCATHCKKGGWPCMRGGMMMEGGMPMGPGMKMYHGMSPMAMPPPPEEKK